MAQISITGVASNGFLPAPGEDADTENGRNKWNILLAPTNFLARTLPASTDVLSNNALLGLRLSAQVATVDGQFGWNVIARFTYRDSNDNEAIQKDFNAYYLLVRKEVNLG